MCIRDRSCRVNHRLFVLKLAACSGGSAHSIAERTYDVGLFEHLRPHSGPVPDYLDRLSGVIVAQLNVQMPFAKLLAAQSIGAYAGPHQPATTYALNAGFGGSRI